MNHVHHLLTFGVPEILCQVKSAVYVMRLPEAHCQGHRGILEPPIPSFQFESN